MKQINKEFIESISRNDVLALDIAEHTGYHNIYESGTMHFPNDKHAPKKLGPDYQQHKAFGDWLVGFIQKHHVKVIAAEDLNVGKSFIAARKLGELRGVLFYVCAKLDIPIVFFNVRDIKKWATGNGNADKAMMIDYCIKRWHIEPVDDNEADATHIFMHFITRYKL